MGPLWITDSYLMIEAETLSINPPEMNSIFHLAYEITEVLIDFVVLHCEQV